ncbi:MAG: VWA domain-containing protein [Pyrinomonadaceae bacterium]
MILTRSKQQIVQAPALLLIATLALSFIFSANTVVAQQQSREQPPKQQTPPTPPAKPASVGDDDEEIIRVSSNLVVVPVSVTDEAGEAVQGLSAADFRLDEEGRRQEIARLGDAEQVPLDIAILLDVSGSVNARFAFEKEAAARFLKQILKPVDRATVFAIDARPRLEQTRATANIASARLMAILPARSSTAFYDTVVDAARYLSKASPSGARRVIIVISDGEDTNSERIKTVLSKATSSPDAVRAEHERALQQVQRELQRADATFYSLNPSGESLRLNVISTRAQQGMQQFAAATGGAAFAPEREQDLEKIFRRIANELRSQYLLQYYSKDESPSGKFLRIKVAVPARPQLRVRARQGYYTKNR